MLKKYFFIFLMMPFCCIAQIKVHAQNDLYAIYTRVDSVKVNEIRNAKITEEAKEKMLREYLQPLCDSSDALACYILATTYDKFAYGMGTKDDAAIALKYYQMAADAKLAEACYFLYQLYRYNFMNVPTNEKLSLHYLQEAKKYGNESIRAQCLQELGGIYYPRKENKNQSDMKGVKANLDSTKYYLAESLKLDSTDTWTLDFIGSIYEDEKNYARAFSYYIKSKNENSRLKIANWLATGRKVKKNTQQAISIVRDVLASMVKDGYTPENINEYMGSYNPAVMLNIFYKCYKIVSREEVGKWYLSSVSCDDYARLVSE